MTVSLARGGMVLSTTRQCVDEKAETMGAGRMWRKHYAIPPEHGAWVWWLGPFALGMAAAGAVNGHVFTLAVATLIGFLMRQPVTLTVKVLSGRRGRSMLSSPEGGCRRNPSP